ncbi:DUF2283 domain-containing protein [Nocardiopsis tropica]|uniref:DUF2283 domain-containing protein n=1 Tax=Nocardiopsis tropica TaxID=109330 RepID=A0ABU7KPD9_9ACTN|nr:DUF2283 domain-containing protein [Nocardiopsis umidischolae]MEE2051155.1 DUF2283 domain-containing protein [Nocardiopsis umidischolae]
MAVPQEVAVDQDADAGYLTLSDAPVRRTADHGSFLVDRSADGSPVGIEVLTLDRPLDVSGVLEVLEESGAEVDPRTRELLRLFAAQIVGLDARASRSAQERSAGTTGPTRTWCRTTEAG